MGAVCYWCKSSVAPGSVPSPVGLKGEPLGTCLKCHVLACGHHGVRDKNRQEFKCYDCLFIKLISSAVSHANLGESDKEYLKEWDELFIKVFKNVVDIYSSFEDFKIGNPEFVESMQQQLGFSVNHDLWPFGIQDVFEKFTGDAEKFLIAASVLIDKTENSSKVNEVTDVFKYNIVNIIKNTYLR